MMAYGEGWETIVTDAITSLIANAAYYRKVVRGAEPVAPPEEAESIAAGELAETEEVPL
ncbi:MAG: hypothetical protein K6U78_18610 [Anaerolineae bacterium]|nr:hypothetical protein [Anaerolineae bacterium]